MPKIKVSEDIVTVIIDRKQPNDIETIREAAKILMREISKYEHGLNINIDW